jgi:hypothetical protein
VVLSEIKAVALWEEPQEGDSGNSQKEVVRSPIGVFDVIVFNFPKVPYKEISLNTLRNYKLFPGKDCVLLIKGLVGTSKDVLLLMESWGFNHLTNMVVPDSDPAKSQLWSLGIRGNPFKDSYPDWKCFVAKPSLKGSDQGADAIYQLIEGLPGKKIEYFPQVMPVRDGWMSWGHELRMNRFGLEYMQVRSADFEKRVFSSLVKRQYLKKLPQNAAITIDLDQDFRKKLRVDFPRDYRGILEKFEEGLYLNFRPYEEYQRSDAGL